ncbi:N-acetyltransferase [Brevundimonas sp. NPDC090276]|uniref:N-acetyltransferase n=1 Tax=Brevundimonas sp. NPDC090276 TaxID=3363956 RepID=UPI00383B8C12
MRPFQLTDVPDVNRLHQQVGWPVRSVEGWRWLASNPARQAEAPLGWVSADADGRAAAFVGNFIQRFWLKEHAVQGAGGFSIIVPPAQRGAAPRLIRTLMRQPDCSFRYTLNANPKAARLYPRLGLTPCPERGHEVKLAWIIDPVTCGWGRFLRNAVERSPGLAGHLGERLMSRHAAQVGGRSLHDLPLPAGIHWISDLSDVSSLSTLWSELRGQGRLIADRSPAMLRWRMADPELTVAPLLLGCEQDGRLIGYAQAVMSKGSPIEPPALEIIDLIALDHAQHAVAALMKAMLDLAPRLGAARVRLQVVNGALLDALGPLARGARREGGWGHCHAQFDPELEAAGRDWRPTPYDGDYAFCLRPLPIGGRIASARTERDAA